MTPRSTASLRGPLTSTQIQHIFVTLSRSIIPKTELNYTSTFELLISVVLSAQATDRSVNAATVGLFATANTPRAILDLGLDGLREKVRTIGLFNTKSKNIIALCRQLIELHGGEVPGDRASLEALPGVGRKTANVVLNIAFKQPTIAVDTHVQRVANRLGIAQTSSPEQTETVLMERIPSRYLHNAHHYLILHGRYCCTARSPHCPRCPVRRWCAYPDKTEALP